MESQDDYGIDGPAELEGEDTFQPSWRGISVRLLLLVLLLWTLIQMVLPRRNLNLQIDQPANPPAEPIEPNYWL